VSALAAATPGVGLQGRSLDPAVAPAAGAEAAVGGAGTVAVLAAATPGVGPRGRPHDPAAAPAVAPRSRRSFTALRGGDLALASPRGGRRAGPGLAAGLASPPPRVPLGRRLSISRVASSFARSPSIRTHTARMSKAAVFGQRARRRHSLLHTAGTTFYTQIHPVELFRCFHVFFERTEYCVGLYRQKIQPWAAAVFFQSHDAWRQDLQDPYWSARRLWDGWCPLHTRSSAHKRPAGSHLSEIAAALSET